MNENEININEIILNAANIVPNVNFEKINIPVNYYGSFVVLKVNFIDKLSLNLKALIQSFLKSEYTNNENQNTESRARYTKLEKQFEGIVAEIAIVEWLKTILNNNTQIIRHDDVREDGFRSPADEFDIKIINPQGKEFTIEVRASVNYKYPFGENTIKFFDTIGPYNNYIKKQEKQADFYIRPLFQLKNPLGNNARICDFSLLEKFLNNEADLYITGGATYDLMVKKGYNTNFGQKNTSYKALKIINGLDINALEQAIHQIVYS